MKIFYLLPGADPQGRYVAHLRQILQSVAGEGTTVEVRDLPGAPTTLEYAFHQIYSAEPAIAEIHRAGETCDAVVMGCFMDPFMVEARQACRVPVVGIGEAAMHVATVLGHKFSIVVGLPRLVAEADHLVTRLGLRERLASIRPSALTITEMRAGSDEEPVVEAVVRKVIEEDGAEVVVAGCGSLGDHFRALAPRMGVPLLDSRIMGLKVAETLASLHRQGLATTSRVGLYAPPPDVKRWVERQSVIASR
ncbi:MAG: hypothetical protein HY660_16610 [Armatimonadetes bacterium]|nr:hypothetical protein [Armatimonadota bacterium]